MLALYHSNQVDLHKDLLAKIMEHNPLSNPLESETIITQGYGVTQWLQLELARSLGVAANIDYLLPAAFIWRLVTQLLTISPTDGIYSQEEMLWRMVAKLPNQVSKSPFAPIRSYLNEDPEHRKLYQLADQVADLFDQYLVYRADWLQAWERGELVEGLPNCQKWQGELWRLLLQSAPKRGLRVNIYLSLIETLQQHLTSSVQLPKRLFVFCLTAVPPIFMQIIGALGRHCDVHWMFLNPCRHYWGDLRSTTSSTFKGSEGKLKDIGANDAPDELQPLLAAWGGQGREQLELLSQLEPLEVDAMVDIEPDTLLHALQDDLLNFRDRTLSWPKRTLVQEDDRSISIHSCHSPMREVEVLLDNLLTLFNLDISLEPHDVVVVIPNIQEYAPYIQAIFGEAPRARHIPFNISEQIALGSHALHAAFLKLLALPSSRFRADELFSLLELPAVAANFSIELEQLPKVRRWIREAGICWGLSGQDSQVAELLESGQNSWDVGLQRMLLGYAMDSRHGIFRNLLPYNETAGAEAELVGGLAAFLEQISYWRRKLAEPRTLSEWQECCRELTAAFFQENEASKEWLLDLAMQWERWIAPGVTAGYSSPVAVELLHDALTIQFAKQESRKRIRLGVVNFCSTMTLRAVPFKVVAMLGMNEEIFPERRTRLSFDLLSNRPRQGDRSRSSDDRYLFLESVLAARKYLYLSYVGRSAQDHQPQNPSILVSELLDYLTIGYALVEEEGAELAEFAANMRHHLLTEHPLVPFDRRCFAPENRWPSYGSEWLAAAIRNTAPTAPFLTAPLSVIERKESEATLEDLRNFYRHPVRSFFQRTLRVTFPPPTEELPTDEPFNLSYLPLFQLRCDLLERMVQQEPLETLYECLVAAGSLPQGPFRSLFWQQQIALLEPLASQVAQQKSSTQKRQFELILQDGTLTGELVQLQADGLLRWRPVNLQPQHYFDLWIEHLVYCATGGTHQSRLYGLAGSSCTLASLPEEEALLRLEDLIGGLRCGQRAPVPLLPKCGWAWLQSSLTLDQNQNGREEELAFRRRQKVSAAWRGFGQLTGEGEDPYYRRLFPALTDSDIAQIGATAQRFYLPLVRVLGGAN